MSQLQKLIREIHRRSLWQVLLIYAAGGWAVLAGVDTLAGALGLPDWAPPFALFLLIIGLPIVLAVAFVQGAIDGGEAVGDTRSPTSVGEGAASARAPAPDAEVARERRSAEATAGGGPRRVSRWLTWRNAAVGGLAALALWGAVLTAWVVAGPPDTPVGGGTSIESSPNRIAVLPFEVLGAEPYLSDGLVKLLSTKLDGAGDLQSVDPHALLSHAGREEGAGRDPSVGRRVAQSLGAGLFIMGDAVEAGGRLSITAHLYDLGAGDPLGEGSVEAPKDELFAAVDELAAQLLARLQATTGSRVSEIAAVTTSSLPALRAYLEGEAELRAGRFQPAFDAFGRAVAEDSTFALAYYRRSIAAEWLTRWSDAVEAAERAQRHAERLSERDRALLDALLAYRRGSYTEAEERYRSIVGLYPDDVEAWFQFAEILFHYNPLRGRSFTESRTAFERTMDLGSFGPLSLVHLARVHAVAGDVEALDTAVEAFLALNPSGDRTLEMRALRGFALRDSAEQAWVMASAQSLPAAAQAITAWDVALFSGNLDGAKDVVEVMAAPNSSDDVRRVGLEWGAYLDVARGRWGSALSRVREIASFHPEVGLEIRAVLALAPDAPFARSDLTSIERALRSFDSASVPHARTPSLFFNAHDQLHPVIRLYLLGLLNARLGATEEAATLADSLSVQNVPPGAGSLAGDLALGVRAEVALAEGEAERALALLAEIRMASWYSPQLGSAFLAQAHNRFLRGEALYLVGRYDEARGWLSSLGQITPGELIYLPAALLRLASAAEQADDLEGASAAYSRFLDLWTTADPELQSRADSVRARLDSLRASSS